MEIWGAERSHVSWYFVPDFNVLKASAAFGSAFAAGAVNAVAGGGTLISYPTLLALGLNAVTANATSTVAIWPGTIGSMWGYRGELQHAPPRFRILLAPSLTGGLLGALLLRWTSPQTMERIVPFLILFATILLCLQPAVQKFLKIAHTVDDRSARWFVGAVGFQFLVGVYGGFFGAGIGILMLAALGILGLRNINQMNALKVVFGGSINGIAAAYFVYAGMVDWSYVLVMAAGALTGGYGGAGLARRAGPKAVRAAIVLIGFGISAYLFLKK
jgi:uncharacterized protein